MSEREWKVGDVVICDDDGYSSSVYGKQGTIVEIKDGGAHMVFIRSQNDTFTHFANEMIPVEVATSSEIDAIERDMADIFARMRAVIERMA